jgi:hypothetical protein
MSTFFVFHAPEAHRLDPSLVQAGSSAAKKITKIENKVSSLRDQICP